MSLLSILFFIDDCIKHPFVNCFKHKELTEIKNVVYDDENPDTGKLDIIYDEALRGKFTEGRFPVFFEIHGGGWIAGDKKFRRGYCQHMAGEGAFTVNVNYGLGPKWQFPDFMKQIYKALKWVVDNAEKYGLDLDKFVISGDSAGGHLSLVTINCQELPLYREHLGLPEIPEIKIKGAILNCPAINFEGKVINLPVVRTMTHHCTGVKHYKKLRAEYEFYEELQAFKGVNENFPKLFLVNGIQDVFCNPGAKELRAALDKLGIEYERYMAYDPFNSFHCFNLKTWMPQARHAMKKEKEFLNKVYREN